MNLCRERYVVFRNCDNKIFCGQARAYEWRSLEDIGQARVCTYSSEKKALSAVKMSYSYEPDQVYVEKINEMLISF